MALSQDLSEEELRRQFEEQFSLEIESLLGMGRRPPSHISMSLISKRNLPESIAQGSGDELIAGLMKLTHVRLDRENITEIDNLEMLGPVTNLYLQQNSIEKIENLECLTSVQFLTLAGNKINKIENLKILDTLKLLDLSDNKITDLTEDELPKSLVFLDLRNNPCTALPDYRTRLLAALPNLKQLDNELLTKDEKRSAGHPVSSDDDDEEEEEVGEGGDVRSGQDDVQIDDVFRMSADFIHQSRERSSQYTNQHDRHMLQIEEVRSQSRQAMETARSSLNSPRSSLEKQRHLTPSPASR
ncbi:leucine-rich repeat-containing protein 46-like [Lytechinus pictus]|uniref:leucine-rich repeat-containing protein 46-like n=1 Tax=Lytechinus pictus TaxID=7653 RepID=UPI0030BA1D46